MTAFDNGISASIGHVPMMNEFDKAYSMGGLYWMILFWQAIFVNFVLTIKLIEYGLINDWSPDSISLGVILLIVLIPMITAFSVWYSHKILGVI